MENDMLDITKEEADRIYLAIESAQAALDGFGTEDVGLIELVEEARKIMKDARFIEV